MLFDYCARPLHEGYTTRRQFSWRDGFVPQRVSESLGDKSINRVRSCQINHDNSRQFVTCRLVGATRRDPTKIRVSLRRTDGWDCEYSYKDFS